MSKKGYRYNFIYKTTNLMNGLFYIGQHSSNRLDDSYLGSGLELKRAVKDFGKENFKREILEICDYENLSEREKFWILELNAIEKGYNIILSGEGQKVGFKHTKETKTQMSKNRKGLLVGEKNGMYGIKGELHPTYGLHRFGEEAPMFGKRHSEETKKKISNAKIGMYEGEDNPFFGKNHSEETKQKLRDSANKRYAENGSPLKGRDFSETHKENLSKNWGSRKLIKCPYCGMESKNMGNMKRYHFENCKKKNKYGKETRK